jgi:hypothetical protein
MAPGAFGLGAGLVLLAALKDKPEEAGEGLALCVCVRCVGAGQGMSAWWTQASMHACVFIRVGVRCACAGVGNEAAARYAPNIRWPPCLRVWGAGAGACEHGRGIKRDST